MGKNLSFILNCEDILNETSQANAITKQIARAQVKAADNMLCKIIIIIFLKGSVLFQQALSG